MWHWDAALNPLSTGGSFMVQEMAITPPIPAFRGLSVDVIELPSNGYC